MSSIWVIIRRTASDAVENSQSFDTDDTGLGMLVGYIDGYAASLGLRKVDVSDHGVERYDLVNGFGKAELTATVVVR